MRLRFQQEKLIGTRCFEVCDNNYFNVFSSKSVSYRILGGYFHNRLSSFSSSFFYCHEARAIENQCYVLAAAQFGKHNDKRESYGHSLAINPWGEVMGDAGGIDGKCSRGILPQTPSIIVCDIDSEETGMVREKMPIQNHRKRRQFSW